MEYNSEQLLNRQRICMKCKSFVTHEKVEDGRFTCPLCGHYLPSTPNLMKPIGVDEFRGIIARLYKDKSNKEGVTAEKADTVESADEDPEPES